MINEKEYAKVMNDDVMPSNAKLCQVPCQNKKRAEPKPRPNYVKNVC